MHVQSLTLSASDELALMQQLQAGVAISSVLSAWQQNQAELEQIRSALMSAVEANGLELEETELSEMVDVCRRAVKGGESIQSAVRTQLFNRAVRLAIEAAAAQLELDSEVGAACSR